VVTDRPLRDIACRGVGIRFLVKNNLRGTPVQRFKGVTGYIPVSTPEATAIDLIRYSRRVGGLDQVLTVLQELGEFLNPIKLMAAAKLDGNVAYAQRLGWLLEKSAFTAKAGRLAIWVSKQEPVPAKLEPSLPLRGSIRDKRWNLWINSEVEGDLS
jgi:predicted transcriptional regulator of viral defense system